MKRFGTLALAIALTLTLAVACESDDGGGGGGSGATQEEAAGNSVDSAEKMGTFKSDPASEEGLSGAMTMYANAQQMVALKQAESASEASGDTSGDMGGDLPGQGSFGYPLTADDPCVTVTDTSATYTDCSAAGATFNGTVQINGDDVTLDLTMTLDPSAVPSSAAQSAGGANGSFSVEMKGATVHETGTLTITDTLIDGTLNVDVDITMVISGAPVEQMNGEQTTSQNIDVVFDQLGLADGCATSGTLTVSGSNQTITATYDGCGNATIQ